MTIPRRGSRRIEANGVWYRWSIRPKPTYAQAVNPERGLMVAVELEEAAGSVLLARFAKPRPDNWMGAPSGTVTPKDVAAAIRKALKGGWAPHARGSAFSIEVECSQD